MDSITFTPAIKTLFQSYYTTNNAELSELLSRHVISEKVRGSSKTQANLIRKLVEFYKPYLSTIYLPA